MNDETNMSCSQNTTSDSPLGVRALTIKPQPAPMPGTRGAQIIWLTITKTITKTLPFFKNPAQFMKNPNQPI